MNKLIKILLVVCVCILTLANVFALNIDKVDDPFGVSKDDAITEVNDAVGSVWKTASLILQMLAIGAVIFAGLRYMFASADAKADIKRSMGILAVGAILTFASITVINFIVDVGKDILK